MDNFIYIEFIKIAQPIGTFYIGNIDWTDLVKIAEADIRKIEEEDRKGDSFDSYLGIQRKVSKSRIKEIADYVNTIDATFPTSIILHVDSTYKHINNINIKELEPDFIELNLDKVVEVKNVEIDGVSRKMKIRSDDKVAKILDGQHRIEGLRSGLNNSSEKINFQLNVTIFIDLDLDDQAQIFSVINKAQTKVNKSLVYDLFDYAKYRSPQKTAHDIVRLLNKMVDSPFYKKIKILGTAENKELETITQATLVELILAYISSDPMQDRDILKRRNLFKKPKLELQSGQLQKQIFRNLFIAEKDEEILNILWNYFLAVQSKWQTSWNINSQGNILNKTTGVIALMRFLRFIVNSIGKYDQVITKEEFDRVLRSINLKDADFNKDNYIPGSSGQSKLLNDLKHLSTI
jgi:DGQHR domain-containing protein